MRAVRTPRRRYRRHFGAGFDTFRVDELPRELEVTILVRLLLMEGEESELDVHVLGPNTVVLGAVQHPVEAEPGPSHRTGYMVSQTEVLELRRIPADTAGVYSVEIYSGSARDGTSKDHRLSLFFNVREGLP